ncbi:hypothetical protein BH24ACT15_BH24ACT15_24110 [soil metagenome]
MLNVHRLKRDCPNFFGELNKARSSLSAETVTQWPDWWA